MLASTLPVVLKEMIDNSVGHGAFVAEAEPLIKKLPFRIFTFANLGLKISEGGELP
jgi:hypothetical protein